MKKPNELEQLTQTIREKLEVIAFTEGFDGKVFLDYLKYSYMLNRWNPEVCCIAVEKIFPPNNPSLRDHYLPVIPLENLVHFRDTALFIVATSDDRVEFVTNLLKDFGCKNIVVFTKKELHQAQNVLKRFVKNGDILSWKINNLTDELELVKVIVRDQGELVPMNQKAFSEYRHAFRGKKVVIFATGPTAKYYKPIPDAIHIGVNFAWLRDDITFDYLFAIDAAINLNAAVRVEEGFDKIREKVFLANFSDRPHVGDRISEDFFLMNNVVRFFYGNEGIGHVIYRDISTHAINGFYNVTSGALQFALYTYPKEIYLVGCDSSPSGHFYKANSSEEVAFNKNMKVGLLKAGYARLKMFAKQYYPDTEIISINPVGLKGLFTDIYTDEYKAALEEKNNSE